jgi:hypothetical protein
MTKFIKAKNNVDFLLNLHYFCKYMLNEREYDKVLILMDLDFVQNDPNNIKMITLICRNIDNKEIQEKRKYLHSLLENKFNIKHY